MANIFTFVTKEPGLIQIGSVVELFVSKNDPSGVEGFVNGKMVGAITNDPNLISGRASTTAKRLLQGFR